MFFSTAKFPPAFALQTQRDRENNCYSAPKYSIQKQNWRVASALFFPCAVQFWLCFCEQPSDPMSLTFFSNAQQLIYCCYIWQLCPWPAVWSCCPSATTRTSTLMLTYYSRIKWKWLLSWVSPASHPGFCGTFYLHIKSKYSHLYLVHLDPTWPASNLQLFDVLLLRFLLQRFLWLFSLIFRRILWSIWWLKNIFSGSLFSPWCSASRLVSTFPFRLLTFVCLSEFTHAWARFRSSCSPGWVFFLHSSVEVRLGLINP